MKKKLFLISAAIMIIVFALSAVVFVDTFINRVSGGFLDFTEFVRYFSAAVMAVSLLAGVLLFKAGKKS